jgi:hypothetical protein
VGAALLAHSFAAWSNRSTIRHYRRSASTSPLVNAGERKGAQGEGTYTVVYLMHRGRPIVFSVGSAMNALT